MAPGGFTIAALEKNPFASVDAITLPEQSGGARYHLPLGEKRVTVLLGDLTMFATEFGVVEAEVPADHPDVAEFVYERPFVGREYGGFSLESGVGKWLMRLVQTWCWPMVTF